MVREETMPIQPTVPMGRGSRVKGPLFDMQEVTRLESGGAWRGGESTQRLFQQVKLQAETRKPLLDRAYLIPNLGLAHPTFGCALGRFGHSAGSVAHVV